MASRSGAIHETKQHDDTEAVSIIKSPRYAAVACRRINRRSSFAKSAIVESSFKLRQAFIDQVVAHVRSAIGWLRVSAFVVRVFGQLDRGSCDLQFVRASSFAYPLYDVPVTVARRELHLRSKRQPDPRPASARSADAFKELAPVERREQTHAGDDVSDRYLCSCLALMLRHESSARCWCRVWLVVFPATPSPASLPDPVRAIAG